MASHCERALASKPSRPPRRSSSAAEIEKFIQDFIAALSQDLVAQCVLEIFEPVSDVINLATCPVDEAVAATFHFVIDKLMDEIVDPQSGHSRQGLSQ